jgi:hypothetical protein
MFVRSHAEGTARNQHHSDVPGMLARLGVDGIGIGLNRAHSATPQKAVRLAVATNRLVPIGWVIHIQVVMFGSASFCRSRCISADRRD